MENNVMNDSCSIEMNNKDILSCILEIEKNMSNNYSVAMNEASSDDLYESFFDMFTNVKDMARNIFDLMNHLGLYKLEYIDEKKINKQIEDFTNKLNCLD